MATANPTPPDHGEDNFLLQLERVREQIEQKFIELANRVKALYFYILVLFND